MRGPGLPCMTRILEVFPLDLLLLLSLNTEVVQMLHMQSKDVWHTCMMVDGEKDCKAYLSCLLH